MFLLAAFLLEPALTFLLDLLFFVTLVLDTMISLLYIKIFKVLITIIKDDFLPRSAQLVKIIVLGHITLSASNASSIDNYVPKEILQHYLSIGEYRKLDFKANSNYAISNKEVVSVKANLGQNRIIVRAKHLGSSELSIWRNGVKHRYTFRVLNRSTLTSLRLDINKLDNVKISYRLKNDEIFITSPLETLIQLKKVNELINKRKNSLIKINLNIKIIKTLQRSITALVYSKLINNGISPINCSFNLLPISCLVEKSSSEMMSFSKHWFNGIPLKITTQDTTHLSRNLKLKTRVILFENAQTEDLSIGLDKVNSKVKRVLENDFTSLINNNDINFNSKFANVSSIATPDIITRPNTKSEISIGSEIPFSNKRNDDIYTEWKFAGLRLVSKFKKSSDIYSIQIETELSKPRNGSITTNKLNTILNVEPGKVYKIAELYHRGVQIEDSSVSYISKVPVLGALFSSTSEIEHHKYISIYIEFEEL